MTTKPSYEELMRLYENELNKNKAIENKLDEAREIINNKNIEIAKHVKEIDDKNEEIAKHIKEIDDKNLKIEDLETKLYEQNILIQELVKKVEDKDIKLKKQLTERFGIKSNKNEDIIVNEAEELAEQKFKEKKKRGRKPGTKDTSCFDKSKIEYKEVILDSKEKVCDACGKELIHTKDIFEYKVDIIPSKVVLTKYIIKQYKCPNCSESYELPRINCFDNESFLTPSLGAFVANYKYNYALPLYRQESILKQLGATLSRQQLSNYCIDIAEKLEPLYNLLKEQLISTPCKVIHADETTLKVIHKKDNNREKCHVWLYASSMYDKPIYIYEYHASRESNHPKEFLKDFNGYLVCDDYSGYESVPNVKLARCWFHAKKKYSDFIKTMTEEQKKSSKAVYFHNLISNIVYENNLILDKYKKPSKVKEERLKILTPLVDQYFKEVKELYEDGVDKSSELGTAMKYSINIENDLRVFFEDGHIPLTNNLAERNGIKPFVILRKNSLFSNTENGAEASCILMTLIQTAKANLLKPDEYIKYVLERIDDCNLSALYTLLPTYEKLPKELKYKNENFK